MDNVDNLMIIFIDNSRLSTRVLDIIETIDDDCDRRDVVFVKVKVRQNLWRSIISHLFFKDKVLAAKYSVDEFPSLVFFENQIPSERKKCSKRSLKVNIYKSLRLKSKRSLSPH